MATNTDIGYAQAAVNTTWQEGLSDFFNQGMVGPMLDLADVQTTATEYQAWSWLANNPRMAELIGARVIQMVRAYTFSARIKTYHKTVAYKRKDLVYGKLPTILKQIQALFADGQSEYDQHIHDKYASSSGVGPVGYDGVALISASHPHGPSGNQSNHGSTANLSYSAVVTGDAAMRLFRRENGESFGMTPTHLLVGPNLTVRAKEILGIDRLIAVANDGLEAGTRVAAGVKSNPMSGAMQLIINPRETGYHWSILDLSKPLLRPFTMLEGRFPEGLSRDEMTDDGRWNRDEFEYSLEGDFEACAGHWQSIYKALGTA